LWERRGNYPQALDHARQALTLQQELGDRYGQSATWDSLGYAHHHLGHHTDALTLRRDLDDHYTEARILTYLGDTHHAIGSHQATYDAWRQAQTIFDELDHPDAEQVRAKLAGLDASTTTGRA